MNIYPSGSIIAGRYEVVQGPAEKSSLAGGMGIVYLCNDRQEDRPVALKTFRPEFLPDRVARDRFLREGTTWVDPGYRPPSCPYGVDIDHGKLNGIALDVTLRGQFGLLGLDKTNVRACSPNIDGDYIGEVGRSCQKHSCECASRRT